MPQGGLDIHWIWNRRKKKRESGGNFVLMHKWYVYVNLGYVIVFMLKRDQGYSSWNCIFISRLHYFSKKLGKDMLLPTKQNYQVLPLTNEKGKKKSTKTVISYVLMQRCKVSCISLQYGNQYVHISKGYWKYLDFLHIHLSHLLGHKSDESFSP